MEITIKGETYKATKLPLIKQFHISRKLAPVIWAGGVWDIVNAFSNMPEADAEYIINACIEVTQRKQGEIAYVSIGAFKALQFDDIELLDLYQLSAAVIKESLGNFFPAMLSQIKGAAVGASN